LVVVRKVRPAFSLVEVEKKNVSDEGRRFVCQPPTTQHVRAQSLRHSFIWQLCSRRANEANVRRKLWVRWCRSDAKGSQHIRIQKQTAAGAPRGAQQARALEYPQANLTKRSGRGAVIRAAGIRGCVVLEHFLRPRYGDGRRQLPPEEGLAKVKRSERY
jgi:hypothetical protein